MEPSKRAKIFKSSRIINGNLQNFESFPEFLAKLDSRKLVLIEIKAGLMEFLKSLIILKEIKQHGDTF